MRRIGRHLGLHHRTVSLWVEAYAKGFTQFPTPSEVIPLISQQTYATMKGNVRYA